MLGELPNSALKRRLGSAPASAPRSALGVALAIHDQADFVLGAWPLLAPVWRMRAREVAEAFAVVAGVHMAREPGRLRARRPQRAALNPQIAGARGQGGRLHAGFLLIFVSAVAKDTEKLIRQLSLISFLMAERRPVSALEIKQDVEGYSQMNDEAFARRFYADRAELESLGIHLKVDKPAEGYYEAENYSLPPENFYLPAIEFTDEELGALRMSLSLLDGEFAYAEPLRLALQQLSWGKPSPLDAPEELSVALAVTAGAGGRDLSQRLSKVETAIFRRKTIVFDYYTIGRDAQEARKVDPYHLLYKGGQFYLIGYSHERDDTRVFRVSRIRGKVGYSSKAEHDFNRPEEFDPRDYAIRTDWQLGEPIGRARIWLSDRIDWLALRHFGHAGEVHRGRRRRDLRDRLRQRAPDGVLGARAWASTRAWRARPSWSTSGASGSSWSSSATPTRPSWPRRSSPWSRRSRRTTTARARRSGPSASRGW